MRWDRSGVGKSLQQSSQLRERLTPAEPEKLLATRKTKRLRLGHTGNVPTFGVGFRVLIDLAVRPQDQVLVIPVVLDPGRARATLGLGMIRQMLQLPAANYFAAARSILGHLLAVTTQLGRGFSRKLHCVKPQIRHAGAP